MMVEMAWIITNFVNKRRYSLSKPIAFLKIDDEPGMWNLFADDCEGFYIFFAIDRDPNYISSVIDKPLNLARCGLNILSLCRAHRLDRYGMIRTNSQVSNGYRASFSANNANWNIHDEPPKNSALRVISPAWSGLKKASE
jgi:hypothetical protein